MSPSDLDTNAFATIKKTLARPPVGCPVEQDLVRPRWRALPLLWRPGGLVSLVSQPGAVPYGRHKNLPLETVVLDIPSLFRRRDAIRVLFLRCSCVGEPGSRGRWGGAATTEVVRSAETVVSRRVPALLKRTLRASGHNHQRTSFR